MLVMVVRRRAGTGLVVLLREGGMLRRSMEPGVRGAHHRGVSMGLGGRADRDHQRRRCQDRGSDQAANCVGAVGRGVLVCCHDTIVAPLATPPVDAVLLWGHKTDL